MFHEEGQYLKRLVLQLDPDAAFSQFGSPEIHLKATEALCPKVTTSDLHRHPSDYIAKVSTRPYPGQYTAVARRCLRV
jgi:hypothetical protein